MINILMIDEVSSIKGFSEFLNSKSSTQVNIKYKCSDGLEGLEMIKQYQDDIDCIILSLVLPSLDGVGILKYLKKENINKRVILYTYNTNLDLLKLLGEYNILFVLYKGMDLGLLEDRIIDVGTLKKKEEVEKTKMDKQLEIVYQDLEEKMKQILGTKVSINAKDENKGKIEIEYYNKEDLDRLIDMILK